LKAPHIRSWRTKAEQSPSSKNDRELIDKIYRNYADNPFGFEKFAALIVSFSDERYSQWEMTRPWRDGGRDAICQYRIGTYKAKLMVDCALEAKCFAPGTGVGIRATSRL
jgi:hypothetical protein